MKHLKTFESFNQGSDYILELNNLVSNKDLFNSAINFYQSLPEKFQKILKNYFSRSVNIPQIIKIEKRYNLFRKIKNLYNNGVRNIKDIMNNIMPKNEELTVFIAVVIVIVLAYMAGFAYGMVKIIEYSVNKNIGFWLPLLVLLLGMSIAWVSVYGSDKYYKNKRTEKEKIEQVSEKIGEILVDNGITEDTIVLIRDKDGNYKIQKNETDW